MEGTTIQPDATEVTEVAETLPPETPPDVQPPSTGRDASGRFAGTPPVVEPPKPPDPKLAADAMARLPETLRLAFEGEHDDEELAEVAKGITAESLQALPPSVRATIRAALKSTSADAVRRADEATKAAEAITAREAATAQREKTLRQREAALLQIQGAAKDPGAMPDVDPLTPEGQAKLAEYFAEKAQHNAQAPLRARANELARQDAWNAIVETHAELKTPKVRAEFDAYMRTQNEGIDPTKERPRVDAKTGAERFFQDRELATLRAEQKAAKERQASDRAVGARAIGRTTTGGSSDSDPLTVFAGMMRRDGPASAAAYLEANPDFHKRLQAAERAA